ncbi:MAG TPA: LacI family DNA-binding transcriptional regulator [bacterium]|nr:LacI family DNA-binding transcriptional regulator [bacterium]
MKSKKNPKSTIYDVAARAGVSISTVSRTLNNRSNLTDLTRQKVLKAIADLDFKTDPFARGLVGKQFNLIEVCFSWSSIKINLENEWYLGLLNGINDVVQEKQYGLLINTISGVFDLQEVEKRVSRNTVDGVLMVSPYLKEEEVNQLKDFRVPLVLIGCRANDPSVDFVDCDNAKAVVEVVDHLVKKGHQKIACITGEVKISADAADRLREFKQAMERHGLSVPDPYIVGGDFSKGSGAKAMNKLLALKDRPTAVFASNDLMALGAWDSIVEKGMKVGKDIALVGFDDIPQASVPPYSLTTNKQDYRETSTQAARLLIEKIENPTGWKTRQILVPTQLVVRRSSRVKY